jgi:tetratricopeptide (TPR) repeat protein
MKRAATLFAMAVVGALAISPPLLGQAQARVHGRVTNSAGEGLAGVQMTLTDTETATELSTTTDDSGRFSIVILNSTRPYVYRLVLDGYATLEETFKAPISSNTAKDFQMMTRKEAASAPGAAETPQMKAVKVYNEGAEAARLGDTKVARQKFEAALELDPELSNALSALAAMEWEAGNQQAALGFADRALAVDPGDTNALSVRYQALTALGREEEAAAALTALQQADPATRAAVLYNEAADAFNAGDVETARSKAQEAVEADDNHAKAHYLLGLTLFSTGDSEGAKAHLQRFLELAPDDPDAATAREMLAY